MDIGTQGLASFVVARAFVPRAPWRVLGCDRRRGDIANVDYFATMATPVVYLEWHRTYGHSILVSLIVDTLLAAMYCFGCVKLNQRKNRNLPESQASASSAP